MRSTIRNLPIIGSLASKSYFALKRRWFGGSEQYWIKRYQAGGNSGGGAYNVLAEYKAEIINNFVAEHQVCKVIEFGSGDGNQLTYAKYPRYVGFDVSPEAIRLCIEKFKSDPTKEFRLLRDYRGETADLALSLDVIYHLVEDEVFQDYMRRLVGAGERFIAIYSSNTDEQQPIQSPHVRHREFSRWMKTNAPEWQLQELVVNPFPYKGNDKTGSFCDFYFFVKAIGSLD